jgi:hypothetical protein
MFEGGKKGQAHSIRRDRGRKSLCQSGFILMHAIVNLLTLNDSQVHWDEPEKFWAATVNSINK